MPADPGRAAVSHQYRDTTAGAVPPDTPGPCIDTLVEGLSRLVEGQRQFAEELGLPYERAFSDGFEGFKGHRVEEVIRAWLAGDEGAPHLACLLRDLADHQMAVLHAAETLVRECGRPTRTAALMTLLGGAPASAEAPLAAMAAGYASSRQSPPFQSSCEEPR